MATRWSHHAGKRQPEPEPIRVLGIHETRSESVRWVLVRAGWKRSDPWMTSFVNADPRMPGRLLGLTPGRSGACLREWLALQSPKFRAGIELVVIDPSAPYAAGAVPPSKVWASRGPMLTGYEHLSVRQRARFAAALAAEEPTNEIAAAHAVKERLRLLLAESPRT